MEGTLVSFLLSLMCLISNIGWPDCFGLIFLNEIILLTECMWLDHGSFEAFRLVQLKLLKIFLI